MSKIAISVSNDHGNQVLAFNLPAYELEVAPEGMINLIDNINKTFQQKKAEAKQTNDETPPVNGETYYMAMDNIIEVETWNDNEFDKQNWASGRATKNINKAVEILKAAKLSN